MLRFSFTPKQKKYIGRFFLGLLLLVLLFSYRCPFRLLFGIPCPGCGMTRAFLCLLRLDIRGAFHYHPLFPLVLLLALWGGFALLHKRTAPSVPKQSFFRQKRMRRLLLVAACAMFLIVYLIRLFSGSDVVYIDFENSLLGRLLRFLNELSSYLPNRL